VHFHLFCAITVAYADEAGQLFGVRRNTMNARDVLFLLDTFWYRFYASCGEAGTRLFHVEMVLDILDIVQTCPKCPKCANSENLRKLRSCALRKFGTHLANTRIGIRADPDSSRHERLVAIASVTLPKRECGRSLKPRSRRGMWECA
jgi:hypothetical protein